jgi:hypothetical protein
MSYSEKDWDRLKHPEQRGVLIATLKELSDIRIQHELWLGHSVGKDVAYGIDEVMHFFFDDTDLGRDPSLAIGTILFDIIESESIRPIGATLLDLLDSLGDKPSKVYIRDPRWNTVIAQAQRALSVVAPSE